MKTVRKKRESEDRETFLTNRETGSRRKRMAK